MGQTLAGALDRIVGNKLRLVISAMPTGRAGSTGPLRNRGMTGVHPEDGKPREVLLRQRHDGIRLQDGFQVPAVGASHTHGRDLRRGARK